MDLDLKAVLFDLDGTLIHSVDHIVKCWQYATLTCLGRELTREEILPSIGRTLTDAFEEVAPGRSADLYAAYKARQVDTHDLEVELVPGTVEALRALKARDLKLGLVTSKRLPIAMRGLNLFGLAPYFDVLVTLEDSSRHKPAPDPLLAAIQKLGIRADQAIYVGDADVDMQAAHAAGMPGIWVKWGVGTLTDRQDAMPNFIVDSMDEVVSLVTNNEQAAVNAK
jgi:pyrophosphatase PpaX